MVKSIVWIVVVVLLMVFPGSRILPNFISNYPIMAVYILVPYVWLLVLAIMILVRSILEESYRNMNKQTRVRKVEKLILRSG